MDKDDALRNMSGSQLIRQDWEPLAYQAHAEGNEDLGNTITWLFGGYIGDLQMPLTIPETFPHWCEEHQKAETWEQWAQQHIPPEVRQVMRFMYGSKEQGNG